jgi:hypothetical protein
MDATKQTFLPLSFLRAVRALEEQSLPFRAEFCVIGMSRTINCGIRVEIQFIMPQVLIQHPKKNYAYVKILNHRYKA